MFINSEHKTLKGFMTAVFAGVAVIPKKFENGYKGDLFTLFNLYKNSN